MTDHNDPTLWQKAVEYGWLVLSAPVAYVWKKTTNSVGREELKDVAKEAMEERKELRNMIKEQFRAAEADRHENRKESAETRALIHQVHIDLMKNIQSLSR